MTEPWPKYKRKTRKKWKESLFFQTIRTTLVPCAFLACRSKATSLIDRVSSAKVQSLYAKAMHANSQYKPAAKAYIKAKDYVAAIRLVTETRTVSICQS